MDLQTIIQEVRERIGEVTEADFFSDDEIIRAVNEGVRRFSNEERWPWLYTEFTSTLVPEQDELALPQDVAINRTFNLNIIDPSTTVLAGGIMLERVTPTEGFKLRHEYRNYPGLPRWYYITRSNMEADGEPPLIYTAKIIPTPNAEFQLEGIYLFVPPLLTSPTDQPAVPVEYQDALPAYAAGMLFLKELAISQKAAEQFAVYTAVLLSARRETKNFDVDEVIAWGRSEPLRGRFARGQDVRVRLPQILGS